MRRPLARHVRQNAVAYVALFVALGGTSYAAVKLPANSVGSAQLKKGAVTESKLSKSVLAKLNKAGTPGPAGPAGATGAAGAKGADGLAGLAGADGVLATSFGRGTPLSAIPALPAASTVGETNGALGGGPIKVDVPARIIVHGSVGLFRPGTSPASAYCGVRGLPIGTSAGTAQFEVGTGADGVIDTTAAGAKIDLPIVGAVDLAPGNWNFAILCGQNDPARTGSVFVTSVDLTVLAVRR